MYMIHFVYCESLGRRGAHVIYYWHNCGRSLNMVATLLWYVGHE